MNLDLGLLHYGSKKKKKRERDKFDTEIKASFGSS